ncbi:hypothetical protein AAC387_Pa08g1004 [Persea americana]
MLKASGNDQKGLYLYVNKSTNIASNQDEEHSRVKRKDMHGGSQDSSNRSKTIYKRKEALHTTPVRKHPTANHCEDNDMHSSSAHNVHSTDRTPRADYDVDRIDVEAEAPNDTICADVDFTQVYGNSAGVMTGCQPLYAHRWHPLVEWYVFLQRKANLEIQNDANLEIQNEADWDLGLHKL